MVGCELWSSGMRNIGLTIVPQRLTFYQLFLYQKGPKFDSNVRCLCIIFAISSCCFDKKNKQPF